MPWRALSTQGVAVVRVRPATLRQVQAMELGTERRVLLVALVLSFYVIQILLQLLLAQD
jgi:hypothetical protein